MFKNYLRSALRTIARNKLYTAVNVLGLALGLCACITIYTITHFEFSFDRYHQGTDRIYRVMGDVTESTGDISHFARVPVSIAEAVHPGLSGLDNSIALLPFAARITVPAGHQPATAFESILPSSHFITTVVTGPEYFNIFTYHWLAGNAAVLAAPFKVVLTASRARQYFGAGPLDKMLGKLVIYDDSLQMSVAGIVADPVGNTDLAFTDFIAAAGIPTPGMSAWIFVKLRQGTSVAAVNTQMAGIVKTHGGAAIKLRLWLEPLSDMHFNAAVIENPIRTAHRPTLYSLMGIAVFILLLAIINFINLSTAQSIQRAKEVGVRKIMGGSRGALVLQFLTEAFVLTFFASGLAALLVNPALYAFRDFVPPHVAFDMLNPSTIIFLVMVMMITAVLAGLYPAKVLSSYPPMTNLKGAASANPGGQWLMRKGLIVFQFTVSLVFITGSIVIAKQLHYMRVKDTGFSSDAIIISEVPRGTGYAKLAVLAKQLKQVPGVNQVALQWVAPMTDNTRGMKLKFSPADDKDFWVTQVAGNEDFIPLYHIKLIAGRNLLPADSVRELVINETLSKMMGDKFPAASIGKTLYWNDKAYPVSGVVADFHTKSLHDPVTPLCIINRPDRLSAVAVGLDAKGKASGNLQAILSGIEKKWKNVYPEGDFSYRFFDESIGMLYDKDRKTAALVNTATATTIFISCIGLFGLSLFTAKKRAKEISIRKILGASVTDIAAMLSKDFIILVIIAFLIASPVAWYFTGEWLQGFAYHIEINAWVFALSGSFAVIIALLTVSVQAIKAAIVNPINTLRSE